MSGHRRAKAPWILLATLAALLATLPGAVRAADPWTPGPAVYGLGETLDVPVTMSDGTVIRVDVHFPTDPATGEAAAGPFPVLLTQTPYGKTISAYFESLAGAASPYLIQRGYIHVVSDVRGTGGSQGTWGPLDPIQARDGAELVEWAAKLPHSNGRVGTVGPSYLGLIQLMTASAVGPDSPLKAIFPIVVGSDLYRDVIFQGGILAAEFNAWYVPLMVAATMGNPVLEHRSSPEALPKSELDHAQKLMTFDAWIARQIALGEDEAYREDYWKERSPSAMVPKIVANGIPAFVVGGWNDLFVRGTPLLYSGFQNAYHGRPVDAPMTAEQPVTPRYQTLMGPWYHTQYGAGMDLDALVLRWFDTWLKDAPTGMAEETKPFHTIEMGGDRWVDLARYPFENANPTTLYLNEGGELSPVPPGSAAGSDTIVFTGVSNVCTHSTHQWGAGAIAAVSAVSTPCSEQEVVPAVGPGALTYTTPALTEPTVIAGPIGATLFATSTRPDTELIVTLSDVAPNGRARTITSGALLGSFRALDASRTWTTPNGKPLVPWHPYTRASSQPVPVGEVTRYDIEVFPTFTRLEAGHQLRMTITTSETPHLLPMPAQLLNLLGGVYEIQRHAEAASFVEIPLAPTSSYTNACALCR